MEPDLSASRDTTRYRVLVLGPFGLERDGVALETTKWQRRIQVLFKLLATAPDRQRRRDDLIDILWPDTGPETGAGNLRMLVHRLRLTLGGEPSPILSEHGWIALNPAYVWDLDLDDVQATVRDPRSDVGALKQAAGMFRGETLVEDRYEDWAISARDRAQRAWRELCMRLAGLHRSRGMYDDAVHWFERLLDADPLDEEALRGLLVVLGDAGRPADALRRYQSFELRLTEELDLPPSADTRVLVEEVRAQLHSPSSTPHPTLPVGRYLGAIPDTPLVGREAELERIFFAVDAVEGGAGRLILLAGEPGVGKTRLTQEVMMRLLESGFIVVAGNCHERYHAVPYWLFLTILPPIYAAAPPSIRNQVGRRWPQLKWLLPEGVDVASEAIPDDGGDQLLMFRAVTDFLNAVARERPLAILVEDLQWADEGSLDLLLHLARQTRGHRVLLLGTYRDGDISRQHPLTRAVRDLGREGLVERMPVHRLNPDGTRALVEAFLGDMAGPSEFSEFVYRRTKGNPYFVDKMVRGLGGRYRLVRQVGAGGMGRVFEAVDTRTGEMVAAKIMFARTEADPKAMVRFQQEGAVLSTLDHANIVKVRNTFIEEHASCIVMELVEGQSLGQIMRSEEIPLSRARDLVQQVAVALTYAHERGIAHRDIKPDNIMVGRQDHVTVTDFGIARLMRPVGTGSTMTSTGMTMGTPLYMAPEQIEGKRVDGRSDVYSLGAVMYGLVTGRPPFEGDDPLSIAFKHVNEPPVPPRAINRALPEDWEALILKALAKDPLDRFQTAAAMERAIAGLTIRTGREEPLADAHRGVIEHSDLAPAERDVWLPAVMHRPSDAQPTRLQPEGRERTSLLRRAILGGAAALVAAGVALLLLIELTRGPSLVPQAEGSGPGQLHGPTSLALGPDRNVYVVDQGNNRVQEFSSAGTFLHQWGSKGQGTLQFDSPSDVAIGPNGNVYVSDGANKRIEELRDGRQLDEVDFNAGSIAVDGQGSLYATDYYDSIIRKYAYPVDPTRWTEWRVPEIRVGRFPFPAGIAVDARGIVYAADREHDRIQELSPTGAPLRRWGTTGKGAGQFDKPTDVALDTQGDVYVADEMNDRIQKFSQNGDFLAAWGSSGTKLGQFDRPVGVAVDAGGNIYVADYFNDRIQKLAPAGKPLWMTNGLTPRYR